MSTVHFAIPGDINTPTGGHAYDQRILALLPSCGIKVQHLPLPGGFPFPTEAALDETERALAAIPSTDVLLIDGGAFGVLPPGLLVQIEAPVVVLLHHPLGLESGLEDATSRRLLAAERYAIAHARHVIVTSRTTAATLNNLGFAPPQPVSVAYPGTKRWSSRATPHGGHAALLSIGAITPRKGYDVLIRALDLIRHLDWQSTISGSLELDPSYASAISQQIIHTGLEGRIHLAGVLSDEALAAHLAHTSIYTLPSRYEGYGTSFACAMAHGLPVVAARAGAVPEVVPPEAGILVPSDDPRALADALELLITDEGLRQQLADGAWTYAATLPSWEDSAEIIASVLREVQSS
ncbi:MAG: glycosyltransferase family 4 protein [Alphaproteobacteria bacterium]